MKYENIVFMQESEADEALSILEEQGEEAALAYLMQWDYGDSPVESTPEGQKPWGTSDKIYVKNDYIMAYNTGIGYIGLIKVPDVM